MPREKFPPADDSFGRHLRLGDRLGHGIDRHRIDGNRRHLKFRTFRCRCLTRIRTLDLARQGGPFLREIEFVHVRPARLA